MDLSKLQQTGLAEKEAKTYLALLELEDARVSDISEKTKINRSLCYSILHGLAEKGIVSYILKNNVRFYRAAEPVKLQSILDEKKRILVSLLPELQALHRPSAKKPSVEILEGREGVKTILNDLLRNRKEWFAFNIPGKGPEIMGPTIHAWEKERQKAKIWLNVICVKTPQGIRRGKDFEKMANTRVRYTSERYESPASNWIYADRIVIIFWYKEFPFAIRIIDKGLAESYKSHFQSVWKYSKKR